MPLADTLQSSTIGSADATAPKADPPDRSETESHRGRRARIPRTGRALSGAPQRRLRLRPNVHQPGGERDYQSYGGPVVEDCRRARDSAESNCQTDGTLDYQPAAGAQKSEPRIASPLKSLFVRLDHFDQLTIPNQIIKQAADASVRVGLRKGAGPSSQVLLLRSPGVCRVCGQLRCAIHRMAVS